MHMYKDILLFINHRKRLTFINHCIHSMTRNFQMFKSDDFYICVDSMSQYCSPNFTVLFKDMVVNYKFFLRCYQSTFYCLSLLEAYLLIKVVLKSIMCFYCSIYTLSDSNFSHYLDLRIEYGIMEVVWNKYR